MHDVLNPFNVEAESEFPHTPQPVEYWSEFYYFFGYDPNHNIGFSIHQGRAHFKPDIWLTTVQIYFPDDTILLSKSAGRSGSRRGAGSGPFQARCIEPLRLWSLEFDGLAQRIERSESMRRPVVDGPNEALEFNIVWEGKAPIWDLHAHLKHDMMDRQSWGSQHWEQNGVFRGAMRVGDQLLSLSGFGCRDHSVGPRNYASVTGHLWCNVMFPDGRAFLAQHLRSIDKSAEIKLGYIYWADGTPLEVVDLVEGPPVNDAEVPDRSLASDPLSDPSLKNFKIVFNTSRGRQEIHGELLHSASLTFISPCDEMVGTDLTNGDRLQLAECPTRYSWDGVIAYGLRERVARTRTLTQSVPPH